MRAVVLVCLLACCGTSNPCAPLDKMATACPLTWTAAQDPGSWSTNLPTCTAGSSPQPYDGHPVLQTCTHGSVASRQGVDTSTTCSYDAHGDLIRVDHSGVGGSSCSGTETAAVGTCDAGVDLALCRQP